MMFSSAKLLTLTLLGCVAASPVELHKRGQSVIIGYRAVNPAQARRYNDAGTITDDGNRAGMQLGPGAYTSPRREDWLGNAGDWMCVILADRDAISRVSKAWVPEHYDNEKLWYKSDAIDKYIKKLESSWDPAKTLRLGMVQGKEDNVQMLIPPGLLNSNGGAMGITAWCKEEIRDLPDHRVDYNNDEEWTRNIKGFKDEIGTWLPWGP